jgi:hypothetical protein
MFIFVLHWKSFVLLKLKSSLVQQYNYRRHSPSHSSFYCTVIFYGQIPWDLSKALFLVLLMFCIVDVSGSIPWYHLLVCVTILWPRNMGIHAEKVKASPNARDQLACTTVLLASLISIPRVLLFIFVQICHAIHYINMHNFSMCVCFRNTWKSAWCSLILLK